MKKVYIAPMVEVLELNVETLMISMSAPGGDGGPSWGGDSEGGMDADANNRRGEWGNLWAQ